MRTAKIGTSFHFLLPDKLGVDVMITIFFDFFQFSAKKNWSFSQEPIL
jgi:hypothetical protein